MAKDTEMQLLLDTDLVTFSSAIADYLQKEKLIHSSISSLVHRYLSMQKPMSILARGKNVHGELVAVGVQTEEVRPILLPLLSVLEAETLAQVLADQIDSLPGVNGPNPAAEAFARTWSTLKNKKAKLLTELRLFELRKLIPIQFPAGFARLAEPRDRHIIFDFLSEFQNEAVPHDPKPTPEALEAAIDRGIEKGFYFLWEDQGKVVSLVGSTRETETEKWIAPVYTPRNIRGRGYGTALTAFVSQKILESGKCGVLFTDQSNPTSNHIYQKIGYRPVADFQHIGFE